MPKTSREALMARMHAASKAKSVYGVVVLSFMMAMYALEHRHRSYVAAFALGCVMSSAYGSSPGHGPSASSS